MKKIKKYREIKKTQCREIKKIKKSIGKKKTHYRENKKSIGK